MSMLVGALLLAVLAVSTVMALVVWTLFAALLWMSEWLGRNKEMSDPLPWLDDVER